MPTTSTMTPRERTLYFLANPELWQFWPFLPMVRRKPDGEQDLGIVYDALHHSGLTGYATTVFLSNLLFIPERLQEFLKLPQESFDTFDELTDASWIVD